ncbi:transposase [Vibrio natriegens]|nr:hypothetical protein DBX26_24335 [Vibrio sp. dhg]
MSSFGRYFDKSEVETGELNYNSCQFSIWCGREPKQSRFGDRQCLGKITKNGRSELQMLFVHGARAVGRYLQ